MGTVWGVAQVTVAAFISVIFWSTGIALLIALPFLIHAIFLLVRPWFLGIFLVDDMIICRNWFRIFVVECDKVESIDLTVASTFFTGFLVGYVPFVGKLRMIDIGYLKDGRPKVYWAECSFGRFNTVRSVAKKMREHAGIVPRLPDS